MVIACGRVRDLAPGFVLGALDPAEMTAVRDHLSACTKPHPELREMGGVLPYLGGSLDPVEPPKRLRAAVMTAALTDLRARSAEKAAPAEIAPAAVEPEAAPVLTVLEPARSARVVSLARVRALRSRRAAAWVTRVAAAVAVVSLVGYAVALQGDVNHLHDVQVKTDKILHDISDPRARSAVLASPVGSKSAGEAWLLPSGNVDVLLHGLEPTKGDEVYTVWSSVDGGAIFRAGWFTVDDQGQGSLEIDNASPSSSVWLMVRLESNSDVQMPTGPVIVTGTIWVYSVPPATTPV
jgi:hypothetical protein